MAVEQITPAELAPRWHAGEICMVDVREAWELETASIEGTLNIPMSQVAVQIDKIRTESEGKLLVVMCRSGGRSQAIANFLNETGLSGVLNLEGGILAWSEQVDSTIPTY